MATEEKTVFPGGVRVFPRHEKAPDFVKAEVTISLNEFIDFCKKNPDLLVDYKGEKQLKFQILLSKQDTLYAAVNNYKKADAQPQTSQKESWGGSAAAAQPAAAGTQGTAADLPF